MSNEITLRETSLQLKDKHISVGDLLIGSSEVYKVLGFGEDKHGKYIVYSGNQYSDDSTGQMRYSTLNEYYKIAKNTSYEEIDDISDKILRGEFDVRSLEPETVDEQGLMIVDQSLYNTALEKAKGLEGKMKAIQNLVRSKTDKMRRSMDGIIAVQRKLIKRLNSIVFTLELYAGLSESVKQIQSGNPADDSEPIYLNQLMMFMDEEVGDPDNGGLSYESVDQFYDWLLSKNKHLGIFNYELLLPQQKCVRTVRVRRNVSERYTTGDPFHNRWYVEQEMKTYIAIRNGENFYAVESKMQFKKKLFPNEDELTTIMQKENADDRYDLLERYKNGMVLMQGLIDRTTVFGNLHGKVSVLSTDSQDKGDVVFQYEMDHNLLTDGSRTFADFLRTDDIKAGDRIIGINMYNGSKGERLTKYYYNEYNIPRSPENGVYKVEKHSSGKLVIKYLPDDEVRSGWGYNSTKRKNRVSYIIRPEKDRNIVNIDRISHRDIDWLNEMMYNRRDRKQYLWVHGLLQAMKKYKGEELEQEKPFVMMLQSHLKISDLEAMDLVHWWKTKNKHKRPLTEDDQKALRMITKKYKSGDNTK